MWKNLLTPSKINPENHWEIKNATDEKGLTLLSQSLILTTPMTDCIVVTIKRTQWSKHGTKYNFWLDILKRNTNPVLNSNPEIIPQYGIYLTLLCN